MTASLPDERRESAALMVAAGDKTNETIAREIGVTERTIERWRQNPSFRRRVTDITAAFATRIVADGIADRQTRVDALNDRHERMRQVIEERAADPSMVDVPGGKTGLIVRQWKLAKDSPPLEEFSVDTGLLAEMRQTEKQAAQDVGQWSEKREVSGEQHIEFTIAFDRANQDG